MEIINYLIYTWIPVWTILLGPSVASARFEEQYLSLSGRWKLVTSADPDSPWAILEIWEEKDQASIKILDWNQLFRKPRIYLARSEDAFVVLITSDQGDFSFSAILSQNSPPDMITGVTQLGVAMGPVPIIQPGRIERTPVASIPLTRPDRQPKPEGGFFAALQDRQRAVALLQDERFVPLNLQVAKAGLDQVPRDATTETLAWNTRRWIEASRKAKRQVPEAEAQLAKLKNVIAEEGKKPDGSVVAEPLTRRGVAGADRVAVFELFTGSECGPCVAADLAFDALAHACKATEVIALQYHVHIPGPDPLANADSVARQAEYHVASTPSTFFNGEPLADGGGGIADARRKLNQYRRVIESELQEKKNAEIELKTERTGDEIHVIASARLIGEGPAAARLRLLLLERAIPYIGANRLPIHHNVVRATIGGFDGAALKSGQVQVDEKVDLTKVRTSLNAYLTAYPTLPESRGPFPRPMPEIELRDLSVVAIVQGADRRILHAVMVPVGEP